MSVLRRSARRRAAMSFTGVVAAVLLAGCGGGSPESAAPKATSPSAGQSEPSASSTTTTTTKAAAEASLPKCATKVKEPEDGYSVALPCGYKRITSAKQFDKLAKQTPSEMKAELSPESLKSLELYALNPLVGKSVNLEVIDVVGIDADAVEEQKGQLEKELKKVGGKKLAWSRVTAGGESAVRVKLDVAVGDVTVKEVQVYVPFDDRLYVWTFASPKKIDAAEEKLVLDSLQFTTAAG
jgi:hypothetical protein